MKNFKKYAALFLVLIAVIPLAASCGGSGASIPEPDERFYVYDEANVLDSSLEDHIVSVNAELYEKCGAQVVVAAVKTTGSTSMEKYAYELFNKWGIGDKKKNNGILILLSIEEDDYWVLQGKGLETVMQSGTIKLMLDDHLEPYFAQKRYGAGVRELFDAFISEFESIYSISVSGASSAPQTNEGGSGLPSTSGRRLTFGVIIGIISTAIVAFTIIVIIIIIAIVVFIIIASLSDAGFTGRTFHSSSWNVGRTFRGTGGGANPYSSHGSWSSGRTSSGSRGSFGGFSFGGRSSGRSSGGFSGSGRHSGGGGGSRGGGAGRR